MSYCKLLKTEASNPMSLLHHARLRLMPRLVARQRSKYPRNVRRTKVRNGPSYFPIIMEPNNSYMKHTYTVCSFLIPQISHDLSIYMHKQHHVQGVQVDRPIHSPYSVCEWTRTFPMKRHLGSMHAASKCRVERRTGQPWRSLEIRI